MNLKNIRLSKRRQTQKNIYCVICLDEAQKHEQLIYGDSNQVTGRMDWQGKSRKELAKVMKNVVILRTVVTWIYKTVKKIFQTEYLVSVHFITYKPHHNIFKLNCSRKIICQTMSLEFIMKYTS